MPLSPAARVAAYAQNTKEVFAWLVTVSHPDLTQPIRLTTDTDIVTSNGNIFTPFPIQIALPGSIGAQGGAARIVLDSVDETVRNELRILNPSPDLTFEMVLLSDPDTVIKGPITYQLFDSEIDRLNIRASLVFRNSFRESYSGRFYNQVTAPGLF